MLTNILSLLWQTILAVVKIMWQGLMLWWGWCWWLLGFTASLLWAILVFCFQRRLAFFFFFQVFWLMGFVLENWAGVTTWGEMWQYYLHHPQLRLFVKFWLSYNSLLLVTGPVWREAYQEYQVHLFQVHQDWPGWKAFVAATSRFLLIFWIGFFYHTVWWSMVWVVFFNHQTLYTFPFLLLFSLSTFFLGLQQLQGKHLEEKVQAHYASWTQWWYSHLENAEAGQAFYRRSLQWLEARPKLVVYVPALRNLDLATFSRFFYTTYFVAFRTGILLWVFFGLPWVLFIVLQPVNSTPFWLEWL